MSVIYAEGRKLAIYAEFRYAECSDTPQHNDTLHNDIQYNDTQHNIWETRDSA